MSPDERDRLTRVEEKVADQGRDMTEVKDDIKTILGIMNEVKGGKKAVIALFAIFSTVGAVVGWSAAYFSKLGGH